MLLELSHKICGRNNIFLVKKTNKYPKLTLLCAHFIAYIVRMQTSFIRFFSALKKAKDSKIINKASFTNQLLTRRKKYLIPQLLVWILANSPQQFCPRKKLQITCRTPPPILFQALNFNLFSTVIDFEKRS